MDELLTLCGLSEAADRRLRTYSKGMLQRAGVAQALVGEPELLILDEPSSGLDPRGQWEVRQLIQRVRERGCTILLCSHALAEVQQLCSRACILRGGRLAWSGAIDAAGRAPPRVRIDLPALVWHERAVEVRADDQAEALRRLIAADVPIQALNPLRPSFEQIYLQATAATVDATRDGSPA